MSLAYLAAPFSHPNPQVKKERSLRVNKYTAKLIQGGQMVYSPLTHNIPLIRLGMQNNWDTWRELDHHMLSKCDLLIVLTLEGWDKSTGVTSEIAFAKEHNIPIEYREYPLELDSLAEENEVSALLKRMLAFYAEREWQKFHSPKNLVMNLGSEIGEVMEHFRWLTEEESYIKDPKKLFAVQEEIGDVMMILLHLSHTLGIDPFHAASEKLSAIGRKYPVEKCKGLCHKYADYVDSP